MPVHNPLFEFFERLTLKNARCCRKKLFLSAYSPFFLLIRRICGKYAQKVFQRIQRIREENLSVPGEDGEFQVVCSTQNRLRMRRVYSDILVEYAESILGAHEEYSNRLLPYSPNTPRHLKSNLSRRTFDQNQKYFSSQIANLDRIE